MKSYFEDSLSTTFTICSANNFEQPFDKKDIDYEYSSSIRLIEELQTNTNTQINPFKLITNPELSGLEKTRT